MQRNGSLARLLAERASEAGCHDRAAHYVLHVTTHAEVYDGAARLARPGPRSRYFFGRLRAASLKRSHKETGINSALHEAYPVGQTVIFSRSFRGAFHPSGFRCSVHLSM